MRVLIAPDDFRGSLSAVQVAEAIAEGWRRQAPRDDLHLLPMSDGGPGFLGAVVNAIPGRTIPLTVTGPLGEPVPAAFHLDDEATAYVESAQACGLHLVPERLRDPRRTTTRGVGELIAAAADAGARRVVVGLGGSGTCDAGAGLLAALGAVARDDRGDPIPLDRGGAALAAVAQVDLSEPRARVAGIDVIVATDVDVPLLGARGAVHGFAAQKFADPQQVDPADLSPLEGSLATFAGACGRTPQGRDPAVALGAGAAGGLGYALLALGGRRVPGIDYVAEILGLRSAIASVDVVVTGEGTFDWQSLRGKVVSGVAAAALDQARPVVLIAGQVEVGRREWIGLGIASAYALADSPAGVAAALAEPSARLADVAERAARQWSR